MCIFCLNTDLYIKRDVKIFERVKHCKANNKSKIGVKIILLFLRLVIYKRRKNNSDNWLDERQNGDM